MQITEKDIETYQEIYLDINKKPISRDVAFAELFSLLSFVEINYQSNNKNNVNKNN